MGLNADVPLPESAAKAVESGEAFEACAAAASSDVHSCCQPKGSCLPAASPEGAFVPVPRGVIQEILDDGCCPLQLRLQLQRALASDCRPPDGACANAQCSGALVGGLSEAASCCAGAVASFLQLPDFLAARVAGADFLCAVMQRQPDEMDTPVATSEVPFDLSPSVLSEVMVWSEAVNEEHVANLPSSIQVIQAACATGAAKDVRDKVRIRLWLERISTVAAGTADEKLFETRMKKFVDEALRRRLEGEMAQAKANMLQCIQSISQCVQSISEEVERRGQEKVAALKEEFDRRVSEQATKLQDMVERRVNEQAKALQVEVDRRTELVRAAVEQRAREQEEVAFRLQAEMATMRTTLEERVREQEEVALHLSAEIAYNRRHLAELTADRAKLEARILETERMNEELSRGCLPLLKLWWQKRRHSPGGTVAAIAMDTSPGGQQRRRQ